MRRVRGAALWLSVALLARGAAAQPDTLPADTRATMETLKEKALASDGALDVLSSLTDTVGPRLAGSPGDRAAVAWGVATLKALGFVNVRAEPVKVPHWERGEEWGRMLEPGPQKLSLCALGGSVPTPPAGLEADVVLAESLAAVDALRERAKGKIVLIHQKTRRAKDGSGYGETVPIRAKGPSRAARLGAVAVLIRSVSTTDTRLPHTGALRYEEGVPKIPAAALATPDADMLRRLLSRGKRVRVRLMLACRTNPDAESANVIGEVRGRERPDEVVVIGGHLDSWDLGTGALDDGAGCAIMIEAGRLIAAHPKRPRRTVRVVLFANEENGARGGKTYFEAHATELPKHAAAFEADSGAGRPLGFSWNAGPEAEAVLREVSGVLTPLGAGVLRAGGSGGVDISPMRQAGVPLFGLSQDASLYFDVHHSADDTFDKVNPEDLKTATAAAAALTYALADLPQLLPRIPESKREPERE